MAVCLPEYLKALAESLPGPYSVWKYFFAVTQIPRRSNKENEVCSHHQVMYYLKERAEELRCTTYIDKGDNLYIRKEAYPGCENKPIVCLQCHTDMVCEKTDDSTIDFDTDPLRPRKVDDYIMATQTSLGADNGIGIGVAFAILEDPELHHGPLEVLLTRDEETGLYGAHGLEENLLKASYMLNLDSEEENSVCIGCSGGFAIQMDLQIERIQMEGLSFIAIELNRFEGGHSSCDIHRGRSNPLLLLGRILAAWHSAVYLVDIDGGTVDTAIPRKCLATLAVPEREKAAFTAFIRDQIAVFDREYRQVEPYATFSLMGTTSSLFPCSAITTARFVGFLNGYPNEVQRWNRVDDDTHQAGRPLNACTSTNLGVVKTDSNRIVFVASVDTHTSSEIDMMYNRLCSLCEMCHLQYSKKLAYYPCWETDKEEYLVESVAQSLREVYHKEPSISVIHGGLECGIFVEKYPNLKCCSIGPELNYPHSPNERLRISSVPLFYRAVARTLESLS